MNKKRPCNIESTHRIRVRKVIKGCFCPLHTKILMDVFETLAYPSKIERLKTIAPPVCEYRENKSHVLLVGPAQKTTNGSMWLLHKKRVYKP